MIDLRRSNERGYADHGWLRSHHSFSFASYHDPAHMQFGPLRVINEDFIAPGTGFGMHGHRDMEIITYVLDGAITHQDNMGNISTIRAGNVQRMSAGTGVMHSEHNRERAVTTHMLQIWISPARAGIAPSYEERPVDEAARRGKLALIASGDGLNGSMCICQDVRLWAGCFDGSESAQIPIGAGRRAYVHVARGALRANGQRLEAGDAAKLSGEPLLVLDGALEAEVLVFDLP
ncbi:MAG: pirin family protein [Betaproteobacteria bacterium]|jgi:redox-sensitive bicupin YhaK (pirin superfamily)